MRSKNLIEGRKPRLHVASHIASATESEAEYIHLRAFDDTYYCDLVIDYLKQFGSAKRAKINRLLETKLSEFLTSAQKRSKIDRLLKRLQAELKIRVDGNRRAAVWKVTPPKFLREKDAIECKSHLNAFHHPTMARPSTEHYDLTKREVELV